MFTGVTTLVEKKRLTAADAEILVDVNHPDHERVYERLQPNLTREIVADSETLHSYRNVRDLRQDIGSFLNRIRTTHGPLFKEMIAAEFSGVFWMSIRRDRRVRKAVATFCGYTALR